MADRVAADLRSFEEVWGRFDVSLDDSRPTATKPTGWSLTHQRSHGWGR